jgi:putative PEP-CTERM system TPR-repeat lipoprotein
MRKPFRKSLLSLAIAHALGSGIGWPATALATDTQQPSASAAFAQNRDIMRELIELKSAVVDSPDDAGLRFRLGKLYLRMGDAAGAEKELLRARDLGLQDYELSLALGEAWIVQGQFRRVFTDDALLAAQGPEQLAALKTLQGTSLTVEGRMDEARDHFAEALLQVAEYGPALLGIAEAELEADEVVAAQQAMTRARLATGLEPAELLRVEGNLAFKLGRFDEAADHYRKALAEHGGDPVLLRGLAVSQLRLDQPEQASATLDRLLALNPSNGDAIALKAQAALRMKDYRTAAELAGSVVGVGEDERRIGPLFTAGAASLANGEPQQAREYLSRYLAQRPDDGNARRLLGQALLQLGDAAEAYRALKPLADDAGDDAQLLSGLAVAAAGAGAVNEAVGYLEQAVVLDPENPRLKAQLAAVRVATGDRRLGLQQLDELTAQDDGYALVALETAFNRLDHGELAAAIATARRVQIMAPDALEPMLIQAIALLRAGQLDAAQAGLARVLDRQPENVAARTGMAEIALRRGNVDESLTQFDRLAADNPDDISLRLNVAIAELQAGRTLQAEQRLKGVFAENPESTQALVTLANIYLAEAQPQQALDVLAKAKDPDDPAVVIATARAELIADKPGDAAARLEQVMTDRPSSVSTMLELARAYQRNAQGILARDILESAAEAAPENRTAKFELLKHLLTQPNPPRDELAAAVDDALRFIEETPSDPSSQVLRGLLLFRTNAERELGLQSIRQVYSAYPTAEIGALLANLYTVDNRPAEAVAILDSYVSAHPDDTYARVRLAYAQLGVEDFGQAADNLLLAAGQGSRRADLALTLAWTLAQAGRIPEARGYLRQAEASPAASPMLAHAQGLIRLGSGDARGAVTSLRQAAEQAATFAAPSVRLRLDLAKALVAAGDAGEARRILTELQAGNLSDAQRVAVAELTEALR